MNLLKQCLLGATLITGPLFAQSTPNIGLFSIDDRAWNCSLHDELMRSFKEVGTRIPMKNPDYNPDVYRDNKDNQERAMWGPFEGRRALEEDKK